MTDDRFIHMLKPIITLLLTCTLWQSTADRIAWSADRKLTWNDFKATPDPASTNAALTNSSINLGWGFNQYGFSYTINCHFNKNKSWGRVKTPAVLEHEQGHFDIAEMHARKLNQALKAYRFNSKTVNDDVGKILDSVIKLHHALQALYDRETDFSRKVEQQGFWLKKIAGELKELDGFANYPK